MSRNARRNKRKVHAHRIAQRAATVQAQRIEFMLRYAALDALNITDLRKRSRGVVSGGYSMRKPELIEAIVRTEIAA